MWRGEKKKQRGSSALKFSIDHQRSRRRRAVFLLFIRINVAIAVVVRQVTDIYYSRITYLHACLLLLHGVYIVQYKYTIRFIITAGIPLLYTAKNSITHDPDTTSIVLCGLWESLKEKKKTLLIRLSRCLCEQHWEWYSWTVYRPWAPGTG